MTRREGMIRVWKRLGLTELQIADALVAEAILRPNSLDVPMPFPESEHESKLDQLYLECVAITQASPEQKALLSAFLRQRELGESTRN